MNSIKIVIASATLALVAGVAQATATPAEIKQLGTTLTPWGAEIAGNKDGSIPAYTGGLTTPPANYDKKRPGFRPNPWPQEKPLFRIDTKNMAQYGDKLSPGTKEVMKKYPTFFIDVYPTHRSVAYPQKVIDETLKNASRCSLDEAGLHFDVSKGCHAGIPFPVPHTGSEVVWNHFMRYIGLGNVSYMTSYYVKPSGEVVIPSLQTLYFGNPFYEDNKDARDLKLVFRTEYYGPNRIVGQANLITERAEDAERRAWSYQPATRRVRLAPDFAGDTPIAATGGAQAFDEGYDFYDKLVRWDAKLIGKQEMYIPYNNYMYASPEKGGGCTVDEGVLTPFHPKSNCIRWELHRVWHVQMTLKPGKHSIYSKRDLYYDEDAWHGGLQENYDLSGKLYREHFHPLTPAYEDKRPGLADADFHMDMTSGIWQTFSSPSWNVPYGPLTEQQSGPDSLTTPILPVYK